VHPDDRQRQRQTIQRAIETGERYFCQYRVVRPSDQRVMWVEAHGDVVRDRSGKTLRVSGVALDVTERMHLEQDLAQRTRAMALMSERKSEFMAMLGHELRSPLAPIKNAIALLSQAHADASARETALVALKRQVSAIERLVEDLFDVSRVEQGKMWLEPRPTDAANLISRAIDNVVPHLEARRQRLDVRLPPRHLIINADELRMVQVLTNLLGNASKFTARGGVISISAAEQDGRAVISVRDNGAGILPENLQSIFETYFQAATHPQQAGLGLGLSLCKAIVNLHSGTIAARSEGVGKGSEFVVTLPIVKRSPPPVSIASPQGSREQASRET
jgi:signal transduction histidine kinase